MRAIGPLPSDHPPVAAKKIGVLLVNLGTPDAPEKKAVKRYLKEFLSDKRVVEIPSIIWQPILRGIILNTRPAKSAQAYSLVWTEDGSPLAFYTRKQAEKLVGKMDGVIVDWAMRYGNPSIASRLDAMKAAGCDRILVAPLYPQYSGATTASVHDAVFDAIAAMRWQPAIRLLPAYHDDPAYIDALATSLERDIAALDFVPDAIVASFHGMPQRTLELGDPYHCHCQKTARLLSEKMGRELVVAFQSRFGRAKWLGPATDTVLEALAGQGKKNIAIFAPGFSSDCLETCEELAIRGKEQFISGGGEKFAYLPCLNDSEAGIDMLETLVRRELAGWI
ncbi:ferrochelatase [uncultured Parasphingorhabdus sp.]|uniref:ferrochelatase n=1 Tax=uncultured Parasphingorhabdus sp. TaxID=2709694 RepID=UPI0030DAD053|tara:strand:- start:77282 stop:78289 length:1008 start_codon:yes stop_codon:yes gene_type:complete